MKGVIEMLPTREQMKAEALERMKMLQMHQNPIKEFEKYGKLNLSEQNGALFWLTDEQEAAVWDWEAYTGNMVYHVIHNYMEFGELLNLLYVSQYPEEWKMDHDDIRDGHAIAHVMNLSEPEFSESGSIGIKPIIGGVIRIW